MIRPVRPFTAVELAIAEGIGRGLPYKQVAELEGVKLSVHTVRFYVQRMAAALPDDMDGNADRDWEPRAKISCWWLHGVWEMRRVAGENVKTA